MTTLITGQFNLPVVPDECQSIKTGTDKWIQDPGLGTQAEAESIGQEQMECPRFSNLVLRAYEVCG
jgi:hypothetical protein